MLTRRKLFHAAGTIAFAGLSASLLGAAAVPNRPLKNSLGYGELNKDPNGLLDLPPNFSYRVISSFNDAMSDGLHVPDKADGMGCIGLDEDRVVLIRNHELKPRDLKKQPDSIRTLKTDLAYDRYRKEGVALPGGTSNIVYNVKTQKVENEFMSLCGTIRNCAGGVTPWDTWLTCEEATDLPNKTVEQAHGYIFEVPASADGMIEAKPLKAMGRFNHEAAAVDPKTGIVYLTEDRNDSLFYRFIPKQYGKLELGGKLQALAIKGNAKYDSRNWKNTAMAKQSWLDAEWITLTDVESPEDDLRKQGFDNGAALFARGEGIHWGDEELYFCCTNGGEKKLGQVMRYQPSPFEGSDKEVEKPGRIQLFFESEHEDFYNFGDNITVTPQGHLLICEDQYKDTVNNQLRGITPSGEVYSFARLTAQTEPAGVCFSPDGSTLFVNAYSPTKTLAITGPWEKVLKA